MPAPGQAALEPDSQSLAAVEAIVRDRWEDSRAPVVSELPHVERPTAGRSTAAPQTEATHDGTASDSDDEAATEEATPAAADAPVRTQREALKARLKEIDRLHRAKEAERAGTAGDNQATDPRDPQMRPYFATQDDYERITVGEDFDGTETGIIILGATYVATSILGAVWAGLVVSEHNDRLRKDIDSTVQRQPTVRPTLAFSDEGGFAGFAIDF